MGIAIIPAAGGGVVQKFQEFTSSGNWTAPTGVNAVEVLLVGGGGGSGGTGGGGGTPFANGAGGGGGVRKEFVSVTPGTNYVVTIGAGGTAGSTSPNNGGTGGNTSLGNIISVGGGGGGALGNSNVSSGGVGVTAPASGGGGGGRSSRNTNKGNSGGGAGGPAYQIFASFTTNAALVQPAGGGAFGHAAALVSQASGMDGDMAGVAGATLYGHGGGGKGAGDTANGTTDSRYGRGATGNTLTFAAGNAGQVGYLSLTWIEPA